MKTFFETIAVALGMFSRLPVRNVKWSEQNRKYALLAFPLVGVVLGILWILVALLGRYYNLPQVLTGALLTGLPLLVVGGIHLDGYADTVDALASHAEREKKLEIMKDPHVGSFAVMHLAVYFIILFAANTVLAEQSLTVWVGAALTFVVSRTLSGLAVATLPMAKETGLAKSFANDANKKVVRNVLVGLGVALAIVLVILDIVATLFPEGLFAIVAAAAVFGWYWYIAEKHFGGINGDLAGWFLSKCELWMLVAIASATVFL